MRRAVLIATAMLFASPALASEVRVIDDDTLRVNGVTIHVASALRLGS